MDEVDTNEYGAPWNQIDKEVYVTITVRACIGVSFPGPANISESQIKTAVSEQIKEHFSNTDYSVENISYD